MAEEAPTRAERLATSRAASALAAVTSIGGVMAREVELDRLVAAVLDQTVQSLGARAALLYQVSEERRELDLLDYRNLPADLVERLRRVSFDAPLLAARAARTRQIQVVEDAATLDPSLTIAAEVLARTGSASILSAPLIAFERLVGVLTYTLADPHRFSPEEIAAGRTVAAILAVGLSNAQAHDERKRAADALRSSEERFRLITENLQDVIFRYRVVPPRGFEYVSPSVTAVTGYTPEEHYADPNAAFKIVHPDDHPLLQAILRSPASFSQQPISLRWVRKDGSVIWTEQRNVPAYDDAGQVVAIVGIVRDVTARKRAEEELRRSEESLAHAQQIAHLGNWDWDVLRNEVRWSDEIFRIFGLRPREFGATYEAFLSCAHPDDRDLVNHAIHEALYEQKPYDIEHRVVRPDGTVRIAHEQADVVRDEAGRPIRMVGTVQDITERKQAEESLRESERQFRGLFDGALDAVLVTDDRRRYVDVNPAAYALFGLSRQQMIGCRVDDFVVVGNELSVEELWRDFMERGEQEGEIPLRRADGTVRYAEYRAKANFLPGRHLSILRDITERKRAQEDLAEKRSLLETILQQAADAIVVCDEQGKVTFVNRAARRLVLRDPESTTLDISPSQWGQAYDTEGRAIPAEEWPFAHVLRGEVTVGREVHLVRPDGSAYDVLMSSAPLRGPEQQIVGAVATFTDITERKVAEKERRRLLDEEQQARAAAEAERARLQAILENAANGILFVDAETGRLIANPVVTQVFGVTLKPEGGVAQYIGMVRRPDGHVLTREELPSSRALHGRRISGENLVIVRPDGSQLPVLVSAAPVLDSHQKIMGVVIVFQDISAIRDLERLREEWTSVIAHDLRAPITVINGYAQVLEAIATTERGSQRERRALSSIRANTQRLARMVSDLLDASRIEARRLRLECSTVDLPDLVRAVVEQTSEITSGHRVRVHVAGLIPRVQADPGRLEQILINLLANAAKYGYPDTDIEVCVARRGAAVEVVVKNCGEGIPPEELPHLFSRFHRTPRAEAKGAAGLGLGLYITKGLVEAHGGSIRAESVPGRATTFRFTLPLTAPAPTK